MAVVQQIPQRLIMFSQPGVAATVDVDAIKGIYYGSRPLRILPRGPEIDWHAAHDRARLG